MPEMLQYCGRRLRVYKRAHKTCDFVTFTGIRRLSRTVHLEDVRCDGSAHGGCQADCLIYWKEAWLRRVDDAAPVRTPADAGTISDDLMRLAQVESGDDAEATYVCQATLVPRFTTPSSGSDLRNYIDDYRSGNVASIWSMIPPLAFRAFDNVLNAGVGWGSALRWLYDRFQSVWGGLPYPARNGTIPLGAKTPSGSSNLQPGELVRVKDYQAILATIDENLRNRGLSFSAEMVPYCGHTFRVRSRVDRIIDERNGKMLRMKTPCIILEGAICTGRYNPKGMIFCPRATYPYWREIWLERCEQS